MWSDQFDVAPYDDIRGQVSITGVGESAYTGVSHRRTKDMAAEAIEHAIVDAGLSPQDIDGIMYHPMGGDQFDEHDFKRHFATTHDLWVSTNGGGMRWAGTAVGDAARAITTGRAHHVVNSFAVAWATQRTAMVGGPGQAHAENLVKQNLEVPFGLFPQPVYAAVMARRAMVQHGTTPEHLAAVATTMRRHANLTPGAVMHSRPMTVEDYFASPVVAEPLRKFDCCLISDGAGAYIVSGAAAAPDLRQPVVDVLGVSLATGVERYWAQRPDITVTEVAAAAPAALAMAGITAQDLDVCAVYDPFTIITLMVLDDLGVCDRGQSGPLALNGAFGLGGLLPTNTHGGLHSHAYVLGIAHVVELVRQLRGEAAAEVPNARLGAYAATTGYEGTTLVLGSGR